MFGMLWSVVLLPFRLIAWVVECFGRFLGALAGFALMVAGVAFCSGSMLPLGIPLFVVGLVMMLRSLG